MAQISRLVWRSADVPEELHELLETLEEEYPVSSYGRGLKLKAKRVEGAGTISRVKRSPGTVLVEYNSIAAAARGIGSALGKIECDESTPFKTLGIMLDVSRNMVMRIDHLKMWLRRLALSGYNMVMLYTEDVYELPDEPFFGYMRGAYTLDEIRELDVYASRLGIELVGCIQTLGHLEQILKWDGASAAAEPFGSAEQLSSAPAGLLELYYSRLFAAGDPAHPCRLYWSCAPGDARTVEDWSQDDASPNVSGGHVEVGTDSDPITGLFALSNQLLIFKRDSLYRLLGDRPEACNMAGQCSVQFVIEGDGGVYPCDFYVLDEWRLGNIRENSFEEMNRKREELQFVALSRHTPQECRSCRCCNRSADGRCYVVISRCNICYDRSKYIERSSSADCLLYLHICFNLIERHMTRSFDHYLNILCPGSLCQFTQSYQFFNLTYIRCICEASRSAGIP